MHHGVITSATVLTFILFLDQFFAPDPAALAGVRPVAVGARVDDEDQRAHAHRGVHARPRAPGRARARHAARSARGRALRLPGHRRRDHARRRPHVAAGETVALVGETGAGKSTIVKLVARFYDVNDGQVLIDGTPVTDLDLRAYRRRLGYVPQEPFLFSGTIRDNIAYGRPDASDAEVEQAARGSARTSSSPSYPAATSTRSPSAAARCRPGNVSSSAWRARCSSTRRSCCSTRPPPTSTSAPRRGCSGRWAWSHATGPRCSSRTASRPRAARIGSSSSTAAGSSSRAATTSCSQLDGAYAELWYRNLDASISPYAASRPS